MAFTVLATGNIIEAAHIKEIQDALTGASGAGQAIALTQLNSSSSYALDVRNLDTTNAYGLRVRDSSSNNILLAYKNNVVLGASAANDALAINCNISGKVFLGDSADTNVTVGIIVNQGANDDYFFTAKSSDVAHGITTDIETDTFASMKKISGTAGGLHLAGWSEDNQGIYLGGYVTNDETTKSTAGLGAVIIEAKKKSGTTLGAMGANGGVVAMRNNGTTTHIFDAEGDSHEDGTGWTAYDDHDDLALLDLVNTALVRAKDPIKAEFWQWVGENARKLEDLRLIAFNGDGHHFINRSKMQELLVGALRQLGQRYAAMEQRLTLTEHRLAALPEAN